LLRDDRARQQLAENGLETIRARHTCAHRAQQLLEICTELQGAFARSSFSRGSANDERPTANHEVLA
jgi:spore maturation protein CgeB